MASKNSKAFVKYSSADTIVPKVLLLRDKVPPGRGWSEIPSTICCSSVIIPSFFRTHGDLKAFIKYDKTGNVIADSTIVTKSKPRSSGYWVEVPYRQCCIFTTTTTTTSSTTTTTTTV